LKPDNFYRKVTYGRYITKEVQMTEVRPVNQPLEVWVQGDAFFQVLAKPEPDKWVAIGASDADVMAEPDVLLSVDSLREYGTLVWSEGQGELPEQ